MMIAIDILANMIEHGIVFFIAFHVQLHNIASKHVTMTFFYIGFWFLK